ncbi:hypothetical protein ACKKBF_B03285 [Auxenochlorella protothecoides x Auxenochlorella symbiontica]
MTAAEPAPPDTKLLENISTTLFKLSIDTRTSARSSEPTTPGDSPISLDSELRGWLSDTLSLAATNPTVYVKLLISNGIAGSIIGKGGTNINDFQAKTFARIQLSKSQEYYPGTQDRTLLISGRLKQVVAALALILDKLVGEGVAPLSPRSRLHQEPDRAPRLLLKMLVPQPLCGIIIGKAGATIRSFSNDTQTTIRVTHGEGAPLALAHRVVTLSGEQSGVLKAVALLVLKQSEDIQFPLYSDLPSTYACSPASVMAAGAGSMYGAGATSPPHYHSDSPPHHHQAGLPPRQPPYPGNWGGVGQHGGADGRFAYPDARQYTRFALTIPQEQAAALSDGGYTLLKSMSQESGARLRLEHGFHRLPGMAGRYRVLSVSGTALSVQHAHALVSSHLAGLHAHAMGYAHPHSPGGGPAWAHTVAGCTYYAPPVPPPHAWAAAALGDAGVAVHPPAGSWVEAESTIEASSSGEVSPGPRAATPPAEQATA